MRTINYSKEANYLRRLADRLCDEAARLALSPDEVDTQQKDTVLNAAYQVASGGKALDILARIQILKTE